MSPHNRVGKLRVKKKSGFKKSGSFWGVGAVRNDMEQVPEDKGDGANAPGEDEAVQLPRKE